MIDGDCLMSIVRVAAVQFDPKIGQPEHNLESMIGRLNEAADAGAKLIVFPECALTGYCFESKEEAFEFAEPIPGPSLNRLSSICQDRDVMVVLGLLERDEQLLYNACALVGPNGVMASYRKVHLPSLGVDNFVDPGNRPFEVVQADGLRIGMHICYDGAFPEPGRIMSLQGADLLVLPTNWPIRTEVQADHLTIIRAYENTVFAMAVNRVGTERGFPFIGRSSLADPHGNLLFFGDPEKEQVLVADVDPAVARQKRIVRVPGKHEINRIDDRRPTFYGPIVAPNGRE